MTRFSDADAPAVHDRKRLRVSCQLGHKCFGPGGADAELSLVRGRVACLLRRGVRHFYLQYVPGIERDAGVGPIMAAGNGEGVLRTLKVARLRLGG